MEPFRRFLEVAAQQNGKIVNASQIGRDVGVDVKTIQSYFSILEDTLLGFSLETYHSSLRKRLRQSPKFYFFDTGVARALGNMLSVIPHAMTSYYGDLFEQFIINEIYRLNIYYKLDFKLYYFSSLSGLEVDLVLEKPMAKKIFIEIKSTSEVKEGHCKNLLFIQKDFPHEEYFCFSQDVRSKKYGHINMVHWKEGLEILKNF